MGGPTIMPGDDLEPIPYPARNPQAACKSCPCWTHVAHLVTAIPGMGLPPAPPPQLKAQTGYDGRVTLEVLPFQPPAPQALEVGVCGFHPMPRGLTPHNWGCEFHPLA